MGIGSPKRDDYQAIDKLARALPGWILWKLRRATGWLVVGIAHLIVVAGMMVGIWQMVQVLRLVFPDPPIWTALLFLALIVPAAFVGVVVTVPLAWPVASVGAYLIDPHATEPKIAKRFFGSWPRLLVSRWGRIQMKATFEEKNGERIREGKPSYKTVWHAWRDR